MRLARAIVSHPAVVFAAPLVIIGLGGYLGNWLVLGAGVVVLVAALAVAIARRARERQWRLRWPVAANEVQPPAPLPAGPVEMPPSTAQGVEVVDEVLMPRPAGQTEEDRVLALRLIGEVMRELPDLSLYEMRHVAGWLFYLHEHLGEEWSVVLTPIDPETLPKRRNVVSLNPPVAGFGRPETDPRALGLRMSLERLVTSMRNEALRRR